MTNTRTIVVPMEGCAMAAELPLDTPSLDDHPFESFRQSEAAGLADGPEEARWLRWLDRVEELVGHDMDGEDSESARRDGMSDGYSLDGARAAFDFGDEPELHAYEVTISELAHLRNGWTAYGVPRPELVKRLRRLRELVIRGSLVPSPR
jgi:hypothetical protein